MQFSLRYNEEIWELTDHEKEVTILAIHWEITAKFHMVPIDYNGFWSFVYSKNPRCWWRHANERWKRLFSEINTSLSIAVLTRMRSDSRGFFFCHKVLFGKASVFLFLEQTCILHAHGFVCQFFNVTLAIVFMGVFTLLSGYHDKLVMSSCSLPKC